MDREFPPFKAKVVLCAAAHPDDLEYGVAGSVAKWISEGAEVHYLICTDGSKGSDDPHLSSADLIELRRNEQQAAADILGVKTVTFLDYEDGLAEASPELKRDIAREIRRLKPNVFVTTDPAELYDASIGYVNHNDHRMVGLAAMDAVYPLARDHLSFPELLAEGFQPHKVAELLFISYMNPTFYVDITTTYATKVEALKAHKSQVNIEESGRWLEPMTARMGKAGGFELGEGFIRLSMFI
jgi:LmbE family N-acetylglucosaminyl deacetylase